ncbi:hypothetical protein ACIA8R_26140 [Nonomuraea sp. NPDC051191]|uniref:hypothetical protein n=1 Tax=Nonomuraea sp. NPDC051191 TaxID=3364372 RepID=UPI00378DA799
MKLLTASVTVSSVSEGGRPSYSFGLAANELPFAAFFWLLLLPTALAFAEGDIHTAGGWAVVALAVVTTIGLTVIARRALGERARIERAMTEGLGAGWRAAATGSTSTTTARARPARPC